MEAEPPPCHLCGNEAVIVLADLAWCEGCLHAQGSCCGESDMDCDERLLAENPPPV